MALQRRVKEIPHHKTKVIKTRWRLQEPCHPWDSGKQPIAITRRGGAWRWQKQTSCLISHPAFSKSLLPKRAVPGSGAAMPSPIMCLTAESVLRPPALCTPVPGMTKQQGLGVPTPQTDESLLSPF